MTRGDYLLKLKEKYGGMADLLAAKNKGHTDKCACRFGVLLENLMFNFDGTSLCMGFEVWRISLCARFVS